MRRKRSSQVTKNYDLDIYRSAQVLVKQYGQDAPIEAAMRADAMLDKGDLDGYAVWKRILRAVEELQRVWSQSRIARFTDTQLDQSRQRVHVSIATEDQATYTL